LSTPSDITPKLRKQGGQGYWIDAARHLRMADDAVIQPDPGQCDVNDRASIAGLK
jgi:aspartate-semialdehyde dehydrogenase